MKRAFLVLLALLSVAAMGAIAVSQYLLQPFKGYAADEAVIEVRSGTGVNAIGRQLVEAGVIRNELAFRLAMFRHGAGRTLKAGEYTFRGAVRPAEVIEKLVSGDVALKSVTFHEGLTIAEMANIFESERFGPRDVFIRAAQDVGAIRDLDPEATDLEGYLFPETYQLPRRAEARMLVNLMTQRFLATYDEHLRRAAEERGMSTREVVSLASLIEKETAKAAERPIVSAVYHNRMRIGMALYGDPTVIYALRRAGRWDGNLTREDLRFDSPYNTYRYAGLPPGPIAAPGRAALEAAVNPAPVPYLYFVSRNDGTHVFSETLSEHKRNVQKFQVDYFRNGPGRKKEAAKAGTGTR